MTPCEKKNNFTAIMWLLAAVLIGAAIGVWCGQFVPKQVAMDMVIP